jgi:hypothetical protein
MLAYHFGKLPDKLLRETSSLKLKHAQLSEARPSSWQCAAEVVASKHQNLQAKHACHSGLAAIASSNH